MLNKKKKLCKGLFIEYVNANTLNKQETNLATGSSIKLSQSWICPYNRTGVRTGPGMYPALVDYTHNSMQAQPSCSQLGGSPELLGRVEVSKSNLESEHQLQYHNMETTLTMTGFTSLGYKSTHTQDDGMDGWPHLHEFRHPIPPCTCQCLHLQPTPIMIRNAVRGCTWCRTDVM